MALSKAAQIERMRVQEVFNEYVKHNGDLSKFAAKLAKKYSEEDGFTYTNTKITKYLKVTLEGKKLDAQTKTAISAVEIKRNKRILSKGDKIYQLYNEFNGDWEKLYESLGEETELTDENNGYPLTIAGLKKYMKAYNESIRPKEVFDKYMECQGDFRLFIQELIDRYSREDEEEYTPSKVIRYLKKYLANKKLVKDEKEQLENIDLLNKQRMIDIGQIIYYAYLKCGYDMDKVYSELATDARIIDVSNNEQLDQKGMKRYLNEYIAYARPKEVFEDYITNRGRYYPFSAELLERYAAEDHSDKPYTVAKLQNLLTAYVNDEERITPDEKEAYSAVLIELVKRKYICGGKFVEGFIHFNGNFEKILQFYKSRGDHYEYFIDPITGEQLTKSAIYENVNFYLKNPNNPQRVNRYNVVKKLSSSTALRNITYYTFNMFVDMIKKGESFESIKEFCDLHGISVYSIKTMINAYSYDENYSKEIEDRMYKFAGTAFRQPKDEEERKAKGTASPEYMEKTRLKNLESLKRLLEHYIQSDERRITRVMMEEFELNPARFDKTLALARENTSDVALRNLINKYDTKVSVIENETHTILNAIYNYILYGIIINGSLEGFTTYDLFNLFGNVDVTELTRMAYKHIQPVSAAERVVKWLRFVFGNQRIYSTPEELAENVKHSLNSLTLNDEEKLEAAQYMESRGWPLSSVIFEDLLDRILRGQVSLHGTEATAEDQKEAGGQAKK